MSKSVFDALHSVKKCLLDTLSVRSEVFSGQATQCKFVTESARAYKSKRGSGCYPSQRVQKTCSFWLLTVWLFTVYLPLDLASKSAL